MAETRSERTRRVNAERERRMVANALKYRPCCVVREQRWELEVSEAMGHLERFRVANAERLAGGGK